MSDSMQAFRDMLHSHASSNTSSSSPRKSFSSSNTAALMLKADLENHAHHVMAAVKHRAAALKLEADQKQQPPQNPAAADSGTTTSFVGGRIALPRDMSALLQQAHEQKADRVASDLQLLSQARQHAAQLLQEEVERLQVKGAGNTYMAGRSIQVGMLHSAFGNYGQAGDCHSVSVCTHAGTKP